VTLPHCSEASQEAGESLTGTAVESVDRWLLLEVTDPWAPNAIDTEALSGQVRERLDRWLGDVPRSRLQLIRRPGRPVQKKAFIMVSSDRGMVSEVELDRYEDLLGLSPEGMSEHSAPATRPICLVCVHGRRDRCCAQHGSAFFRALQGRGLDVWQTSHLGGHRFAACALWLPAGLMYGRLRPEDADSWVSARANDALGELAKFRGRCAYDRPTQAAEILLRSRLGEQSNDAITWVSTTASAADTWEVQFRVSQRTESVRVHLEHTGISRPASCGKDPEPMTRFVEDHHGALSPL
jgi:hypothetical protein